MTEVEVGKPIPLTLQVFDGNENLSVNSILFDRFGKILYEVKLHPATGGLYVNFEVQMPDEYIVIAQYYTNKPDDYEIAQDVFKSIPKPIKPEKIIIGEVIEKSSWDDNDIIIGEAHVDEEIENT